MLETNTQNNSALISLSRAAQITGYHQDYLGQLCRIGKLSAVKVGRNWFTFPEALGKIAPSQLPQDLVEAPVIEDVAEESPSTAQAESSIDFTSPRIIHNITVSQVEGLPIAIRTIPTPTRSMNNVQNILTTLRIESLQREVLELRQLLNRLMTEVTNHSVILSARVNSRQTDSLKHSYVSNFDFSTPYSNRNFVELDQDNIEIEQVPQLNRAPSEHGPRYSIIAIMSGAVVMVAIALMTYSIVAGNFFGDSQPQVSTIYHQTRTFAQEPYTVLQPTVAGDTLPPEFVGTAE